MFTKVRKSFGKQFPLATLFQAPTIEKLALHIREKETVAPWSSLVPIQPNGNKPPLFCMHAGGGTVLFYNSLSSHLGADQPVYGLQAKGVNGNEAPHTSIEDMASHYIKEIRSIQTEGPYYLVGYCLGGILAFEMAQQLVRQHEQIALLASFNGVSPKYIHPPDLPIVQEGDDVESTELIANKWKDHWKKFINLDIEEKILYPFSILMKRFMTYDQMYKIRKYFYNFYISRNRPLPEVLGKIYFLDTNDHMTKAYKPKPYPGKMVIFRSAEIYPDPELGWDGLVEGGLETCDIPGKHENRRAIMNEPFVRSTAEQLRKYLKD
jgi:thioesterase domain-containing protein